MSINAVGTPLDLQLSPSVMTPALAQVAPRGVQRVVDSSLPATSQVVDVAELEAAVANLKRFVPASANSLTFSIDEDSGRVVVKVLDADTQDLIRQIPSEEVLALSRSLDKIKGLLLDGQA